MSSKNAPAEGEWKSATDSKSGRTYYYHTKTKATTWTKPLELAGPEERKLMIEMKEKTLQFFREMEQNILTKIEKAREIDERNRQLAAEAGDGGEDEDGFYYLDDLNDAKEGEIPNRGMPFAASSSSAFTASRSVNALDSITKLRMSELHRATSGSGDATQVLSARESLGSVDYGSFDPKMAGRTRKNSSSGLGLGPPRRIRTISTMDDEILLTMRRNAGVAVSAAGAGGEAGKRGSYYNSSSGAAARAAGTSRDPFLSAQADEKDKFGGPLNLIRDTSKEISDRVADRYPVQPPVLTAQALVDQMATTASAAKKPRLAHLRRRNSTGTIFLSHTMSNQDNAATIECVCVVIRAHMLDAAKENVVPLPEYDVFKDASFQQPPRAGRGRSGSTAGIATVAAGGESKSSSNEANVPSLSTVKDFFMYLFSKSQLESDTIIMALIYCERLVKETKGRLCIRYDNWRSILFACLVMASKVWDDLSMWNVDFSQVYPSFDLRRVNTLELAMLDALKYVIRVSASEYAKYYFHLRSMMARLGLNHAGEGDQLNLKPLDIAGARKLQLSTVKALEQQGATAETTRRRFYSVNETGAATTIGAVGTAGKVVLEQLVGAEHMDADGQVHMGKKASFKSAEGKSSKRSTLPEISEAK